MHHHGVKATVLAVPSRLEKGITDGGEPHKIQRGSQGGGRWAAAGAAIKAARTGSSACGGTRTKGRATAPMTAPAQRRGRACIQLPHSPRPRVGGPPNAASLPPVRSCAADGWIGGCPGAWFRNSARVSSASALFQYRGRFRCFELPVPSDSGRTASSFGGHGNFDKLPGSQISAKC